MHNFDDMRQMMVQALVATCSAFLALTFLYSVVWRVTRKRVAGVRANI